MQTALIALTSSIGLLAVASIVVEFLMLNCFKASHIVSQYKTRVVGNGDLSEIHPVGVVRAA
jgi:hypothetical protein